MGRYFFNVAEAEDTDSEGQELPDMGAVRAEATNAAREILSETALEGSDRADWTMVVTGEDGERVLTLRLGDTLTREPGTA